MLPTLAAAAGDPNVVENLKKGYKSGNKTFKVHIDGYNLIPFLREKSKRIRERDSYTGAKMVTSMALRVGDWKVNFLEQRAHGFDVWKEPMVAFAGPEYIEPENGSFERATEDATMFYGKWCADRTFLLVPAQAIVGEFLKTFRSFRRDKRRRASASIRRSRKHSRIRKPWPRPLVVVNHKRMTER
jgi:arylsulfatase